LALFSSVDEVHSKKLALERAIKQWLNALEIDLQPSMVAPHRVYAAIYECLASQLSPTQVDALIESRDASI
jgi:hypothetical protein